MDDNKRILRALYWLAVSMGIYLATMVFITASGATVDHPGVWLGGGVGTLFLVISMSIAIRPVGEL